MLGFIQACIFLYEKPPKGRTMCITYRNSIKNLFKGEYLRLFGIMSGCFFVLVAKSWKKGTRHAPLSFLRSFLCMPLYMCALCVCLVCMLCWMWTARLAPVITHIPGVRGQTKARDDTADPTISLSPAVNSNLARHGALHSSTLSRC